MSSNKLSKIMTLVWQSNLFLFCVGLFTSKSGLSIFGGLLLIQSFFLISWVDFKKEKVLLGAVGLYILAAFLGLFSLNGASGVIKLLYSWLWPLLVLPAFVVYRNRKDWVVLGAGLVVGFVGATFVALYKFFTVYGGVFTSKIRVAAFWDFGRWSTFMAVSCIVLVCLIHSKQPGLMRWRNHFFVLLGMGGSSLILSNSRGPWLGFVIAFIVFCFLPPRRIKYIVLLGAALVGLTLVSGEFRHRLFTIAQVHKDEQGKLTSVDHSNAGRLHMWVVAFDFFREQPLFGTGFKGTEEPLRNFLNRQSAEYREKYVHGEFSYRDQHSSYLTLLVEMGVFFTIAFLGYILWALKKAALKACYFNMERARIVLMVLIVHLVIFVFYGSVQSYEMATLFPLLVLLCDQEGTRTVKDTHRYSISLKKGGV